MNVINGEKVDRTNKINYPDITEFATDGRLVEPNFMTKGFRLRDAEKEVKRLGRPLTDEEAKAFEYDINEE